MKRFFKALYMTFGTFCVLPLPKHFWDEDCANLMMTCLPIVGILIGAIWWGAAELLIVSGISAMLAAAILTPVIFFAAGLIHLDGYMDTSDAILSRRPLEEKIRILKDPHIGSFAVVMTVALFLVQFAASYTIIENGNHLMLLVAVAVISRCCSAMASICLKPAAHSGYIKLYQQRAGSLQKVAVPFIAANAIAFAFCFAGIRGLAVTASVFIGYTAAMTYAYRDLKGVSGDIAGFSLIISELCGIFTLAAYR